MKNKIIIFLMLLLVLVLATVAWRSISQDAAQVQVDRDEQSQPISDTENQNGKVGQEFERLNDSESAIDSNEQLSVVNQSEQSAGDTEDQSEDKLCELVSKYDDWQNSGSGYNSQKLVDEIRSWGNTRGYFEMEYNGSGMEIKKTSDYDYYETEDLQQMADAGDPIANVKYAYRLFLQGDPASLEEAQPYCEKAVVHGYSAMLRCKTSYLNHIVTQHENQEEPDAERIEELHVEIQAWQKLYQLRNDPLGQLFEVQFFTEVEGVEVDDEEVNAKAQTLYADIVKRRNNLGLGEFDSEPAPDIINYAVENNIQEGAVAKCFE
ncbi:hypothetical protein [Kangiella aquimarina]|uniref:Sel1 repeat family protein n=1 Tax=Kangiella aquimarina TaxID=261965 RepID=A0ABZ0X5A8_9GAMM|nr:hypothetical protein [Kangiella aquimarina]WQG85790.1 hypothetical protein SR900_02625 [Kangiella aquimarina]